MYVVCVCAHVIQQQWKFLSFPTQSSQHRRPLQSTYFWYTSQTLRSMSPKLPTLPHIYTLHCQSPPPPINNPFLNTKNSIFYGILLGGKCQFCCLIHWLPVVYRCFAWWQLIMLNTEWNSYPLQLINQVVEKRIKQVLLIKPVKLCLELVCNTSIILILGKILKKVSNNDSIYILCSIELTKTSLNLFSKCVLKCLNV